jgi:hypothetical protein
MPDPALGQKVESEEKARIEAFRKTLSEEQVRGCWGGRLMEGGERTREEEEGVDQRGVR